MNAGAEMLVFNPSDPRECEEIPSGQVRFHL